MIDRQDLIRSFETQEEKYSFARILDIIEVSLKNNITTFSDFLDPFKLKQYTEKFKLIKDVNYKIFGGYEEAERQMIAFYNYYNEISENDFPICILKIKSNDKFSKPLNHREYLGSILGTGIERSKLGDLIVEDNQAFAFINQNIADYVYINLTKVSHSKVDTSILELGNLKLAPKRYKEAIIIVQSLRLDSIISSTFHISRSKASSFINSEKVIVNGIKSTNNSMILKENDIFSLKGFGKAKFIQIQGKTNKERMKILIYLYI